MIRLAPAAALFSLSALLLPGPTPAAHAQEEPTAELRSCDYAACALRVRDGAVLAGEDEREVARLGWFTPPDLRERMEISEEALRHFGIVERNYRSGAVLSILGQLVAGGGFLLVHNANGDAGRWAGIGIEVAGIGVSYLGLRRSARARGALTDAVWWYNRELARVEGPPAL